MKEKEKEKGKRITGYKIILSNGKDSPCFYEIMLDDLDKLMSTTWLIRNYDLLVEPVKLALNAMFGEDISILDNRYIETYVVTEEEVEVDPVV